MKKNSIIVLAALVIALGLLIGGWMLLKNRNDKIEAQKEAESAAADVPDTVYVKYAVSPEEITSISYEGADGSHTFERNESGEWVIDSNENFPLKQEAPDAMASALAQLTADRKIENGDEDTFGFDKPSLTVKAGISGEDFLDLTFGATNSFVDDDYYLRNNETGEIYLVKQSAKVVFDYTKAELVEVDPFPSEITDDVITSITVVDEEGHPNTVKDEEGITKLASLFYTLSYSSEKCCFDEEKTLADYGIGKSPAKLTVCYAEEPDVTAADGSSGTPEEKEYTILFGNSYTNEDGTAMYYYSTPGSKIPYSLSFITYEDIMSYTAISTPRQTSEDSGSTIND